MKIAMCGRQLRFQQTRSTQDPHREASEILVHIAIPVDFPTALEGFEGAGDHVGRLAAVTLRDERTHLVGQLMRGEPFGRGVQGS